MAATCNSSKKFSPSRPMVSLLVVAIALCNVHADSVAVNPIRKVVTLMQNMQKEIGAENKKETELYDKFMCYCNSGSGELKIQIETLKGKISELGATVKSQAADKIQTEQELAAHKTDRTGAKQDLEKATSIREREASEYEAAASDSKANLASMAGAIESLEKGASAASFVQLPAAERLQKLIDSLTSVDAGDRRQLSAFLQQSEDSPSSGQIVGILKQMHDEMQASSQEDTSTEEQASASFADLKATKEQEVKLASKGIETKTARVGELAVSVVQSQDALEDSKDELSSAEKFSAALGTQCATKTAEWAHIQKMRTEEVAAISEAISILNDDDALDVFKKAVPAAMVQESVGFLQRMGSRASRAKKALAILAAAAQRHSSLKLLLFNLNSKLRFSSRGSSKNFTEILQMLDNMVELLRKEQKADEKQKYWCREEFDKSEDEHKAATSAKEKVEAQIGELGDRLMQLGDELTSLNEEISQLDRDVAEATEQRKLEHTTYAGALNMNRVALALVEKAKNRLNKFYSPSLYVAPPTTTTLSPQDSPYGLIQLSVDVLRGRSHVVKQPVAPEGPAAYEKKSGKSAGVIGLMDGIVKDLSAEGQDMQLEEKTAQSDYVRLMSTSQASRESNIKGVTSKQVTKAEVEQQLNLAQRSRRATLSDLSILAKYTRDLHLSCDFILENFDMRKEARASETDSLTQAKAVLSGASSSAF